MSAARSGFDWTNVSTTGINCWITWSSGLSREATLFPRRFGFDWSNLAVNVMIDWLSCWAPFSSCSLIRSSSVRIAWNRAMVLSRSCAAPVNWIWRKRATFWDFNTREWLIAYWRFLRGFIRRLGVCPGSAEYVKAGIVANSLLLFTACCLWFF